MNNLTEIDKWLVDDTTTDNPVLLEKWEPIFEPDRHLVYSKLGPFWKLYSRPEKFIKRFYHQLYPLPIEHWIINRQLQLYDGFCTIDVVLDICFQGTLKYALNNISYLSEINTHIKNTYEELLNNLIDNELLSLSDGAWVQKGITDLEQKISFAIGEMLILQNIQSRALCTITPLFAEFPDVQLAQKNVYLCVLKKSFEINNTKRQELLRQEQAIEKQEHNHKQRLLEQLKLNAELERVKQAQDALNKKLLLEDQEKYLLEQFEIEKRIHAEKIKQEIALKDISWEAEQQQQQKHKARLRLIEEAEQIETLAHQAKLKEKKLAADISNYQKHQTKWREAKRKVHGESSE